MIDVLIIAFIFFLVWFGIAPLFRHTKTEQKKKGIVSSIKHHIDIAQRMETLLKHGALIPMSDMLCTIILGRKLRSLSVLKDLKVGGASVAWEDARRRYHDHRGLITNPAPLLILPTQEQRRQKMLIACRMILNFLRKELSSHPHHPEWVRAEIQRLTEIDIELSVDGDLHQARNAMTVGREGSARQFLTKARDTLMRHPHAAELKGLREDVIRMLERHNIEHNIPSRKQISTTSETSDDGLERMFGEKQGW